MVSDRVELSAQGQQPAAPALCTTKAPWHLHMYAQYVAEYNGILRVGFAMWHNTLKTLIRDAF
jgi:hypothetical protein